MLDNSIFLKNIWNKTLELIKKENAIDTQIIDAFFTGATLVEVNEVKAIIKVENVISLSILNNDIEIIKVYIQEALELNKPINVEIVTEYEFNKIPKINDIQITQVFDGEFLGNDRTFDNFVVGDCNRESHAAALASAYNPGKFFNPLFIYGNSGLGKTHLLFAIGNYVKKLDKTKKIYYTDSLKFVETVADNIKNGSIDSFKKYMYGIDVLLIDDIQFLANKEKSHEVFFTIFNELVNNGKQICIVSDRLPQEIKGLENRLISRFNSGLSVGIDSPEFETSLAILKMKLQNTGFDQNTIDNDALSLIASNFSKDVRSLEGALNRVLFYSIQFKKEDGRIDLELASNALKGQTIVSDKSGLSPKKIIKVVSEYYCLSKQQITSKTRTKNIAMARHISIYLCRKLLDLPYIKIGEEFGGRDHSTVMSACEKVENQIKINASYKQAINEIENLINQ